MKNMDISISRHYWIIVLFILKIAMITKPYRTMDTRDTCVKYFGNKCLYHRDRRYVFNIGRQQANDRGRNPGQALFKLPNVLEPITIGPNGPVRGPKYDPNYGFEPYWPTGDWVFVTTTVNPNITQTGSVCGEDCSPIFKRYGHICGRNKKHETQDFANYCVMRNVDCNDIDGWYIAHRGFCRPEVPLHFTLPSEPPDPLFVVKQVSQILADYSKRQNINPTGRRHNISTIKY